MDKTVFLNSRLIAKIQKNNLTELRFSILKNNMVDARMYMFFPNDSEPRPTKKGIWIPFNVVPNVIAGLEELQANQSKDILLEFDRTKSTEKMRVYTADFRNEKLIHIRVFYTKEGELLPGKGVSFPFNLLQNVIEALKKTLAEK